MSATDGPGLQAIDRARLVQLRPVGALSAHVDSIWFSSRPALSHARERSLPTGRVDIVIPLLQESIVRFASVEAVEAIHLRGAVVSGAHDRFAVRGTMGASCVLGVHFRAGGAAAFFGGALPALRNRTVLLDELWGASARDLHERLRAARDVPAAIRIVEATLLARLRAALPADAMVAAALRELARDPAAARIASVQRESSCSPQPFIRRFEAVVGITPKRYARVLRFSSLLARAVRVGPRDWAALAADCGYFDQSHLIHEFHRLAGVTPKAYRPLAADMPAHLPVVGAE